MKKNILIINTHLKIGGIERSLVDLLRHINYNQYNVDLLLLEGAGEYLNEIPNTVNIIQNDIRPAYGPIATILHKNIQTCNWFAIKYRIILILIQIFGSKGYLLMRKLLKIKKKYDIAIAYRIGLSTDIIAYGITSKQKLCWWHHGAIQVDVNKEMLLKAWSHFNSIIAVSLGVYNILSNFSNNLTSKIVIIPNMIDTKQICSMSEIGENPYNDYIGLKFVTVGRITVEKHIENVVKAAKRLKSDNKLNFKWYIIGDGELYDYIDSLIYKEGVDDHVILCGNKANPYPYIRYADMMIHTSHVESQGLVIQEAMALNTPCVVTKSIGPSEFIINGKNGVLVEPSIESLIDGIYLLAENKQLQVQITTNAQATLSNKYTPQTIINKIENLFNSI